MSLPGILRNDYWDKEKYTSFRSYIKDKELKGLTDITITNKDISKCKFKLSDMGKIGQIIEYENSDIIWKIEHIVYENSRPISVRIVRVQENALVLHSKITDLQLYETVTKITHGQLKKGTICMDDDGDALKVLKIYTKKIQNNKKSFDDEINNPLKKIVYDDVIYVKYKVLDHKTPGYVLPEDFDEEEVEASNRAAIYEKPFDEFIKENAITSFTSLKEVDEKMELVKSGVIPELDNLPDENEKSDGLVSTSNNDFLKSVEATTDKRRNAALIVEYSLNRVVTKAKRELDEKKRQMDLLLEKQKDALSELMAAANRAVAIFKRQLKKIQRLITTLEIYLGIHENVIQISEGEPAPATEPIHLFQQLKYMDEEFGDPRKGGLDYSMIEQWDEWMIRDRNFEKIVPTLKGICIMRVRRYRKDYGKIHPLLQERFDKLNEQTYVVMRNGDNVYRIWSEHIEAPDTMFPKRSEIQDMLDKMHKELEDADESYIEKKSDQFDDHIFNYKRIMLMIQGILYRTEIFVPIPVGLDIFKPQTHEGKLVFVYDAELTLPSGRLSFNQWKADINKSITKGSRIVVAFGEIDGGGRRGRDGNRLVIYFKEGSVPPGPSNDIYSVEEFKREETVYVTKTLNRKEYMAELERIVTSGDKFEKERFLSGSGKHVSLRYDSSWTEIPDDVRLQYGEDKDIPGHVKDMYRFYEIPVYRRKDDWHWVDGVKKPTINLTKVTEKVIKRYNCIRYNPGDTVYAGWGKSFDEGNGYSRERKVPLTYLIYPDTDDFILNYDKISLDDVEFYIESRVDRKNYLTAIPLLYQLRDKLLEEKAWEEKFVAFTETEIKKDIPTLEQYDLKPSIWKAVAWYKDDSVRVWKRAITENDTLALRLIKQEARRVIRKELGIKIDSGVDNTKKILVFKFENWAYVGTGLTKAQFINQLKNFDRIAYCMRKTFRQAVPEITIARLNREITDSKNPTYTKALGDKVKKIIQVAIKIEDEKST